MEIPDQVPSHPIYGLPTGEDLRSGRIGWAFDRGDESDLGHCLYCGARGEGFDEHVAPHLEPEYRLAALSCKKCLDLLSVMRLAARPLGQPSLEGKVAEMEGFVSEALGQFAEGIGGIIVPGDAGIRWRWSGSEGYRDWIEYQTPGEFWCSEDGNAGTLLRYLGFV